LGSSIWRFFNGAQIMIDQFIAAGEDKWAHTKWFGTMLLPHGYEGQGAEHSSDVWSVSYNNVQIIIFKLPTVTPANHFHLLRRQLKREFRKPLVVFSPKMLLRYPAATSSLDEMAKGSFQEVIDDQVKAKDKIDTVVFCSGKFYYEMKEKATELGVDNMAFVRVEQLYPLPKTQIENIIASYKNAKNIVWAQEEPANMGAWTHIAMSLRHIPFKGITRRASAAAAEGSKKLHEKRLKRLFEDVFQFAKVKI
jgi:2-oxoglutarate dehydrogenase E1 component